MREPTVTVSFDDWIEAMRIFFDETPWDSTGYKKFVRFVGMRTHLHGNGIHTYTITVTAEGSKRIKALLGPHAKTMIKVYELQEEADGKNSMGEATRSD